MNAKDEAYIRGKFAEVQLKRDPFPYFMMENVFPEKMYRAMERAIPPDWLFQLSAFGETVKLSSWKQAVSLFKQKQIVHQAEFAIREPWTFSKFGLSLHSAYWRRRFGPAVQLVDKLMIELFKSDIEEHARRVAKYGVQVDTSGIELEAGFFTQRAAKWGIPPHAHRLTQVIQSLIYFPSQTGKADEGTVVFRLKKDQKVKALDFHTTVVLPMDEFEQVTVAPYKPNCMIGFVNTPEAFHSSPLEPNVPSRRYIYTSITVPVEFGEGTIDLHPSPEQLTAGRTRPRLSVS